MLWIVISRSGPLRWGSQRPILAVRSPRIHAAHQPMLLPHYQPHDPTITGDPAEWNSLFCQATALGCTGCLELCMQMPCRDRYRCFTTGNPQRAPEYLSIYEAAMFGLLHSAHIFIPTAAFEEIRCFLSDCIQLTAGRNKIEELGDSVGDLSYLPERICARAGECLDSVLLTLPEACLHDITVRTSSRGTKLEDWSSKYGGCIARGEVFGTDANCSLRQHASCFIQPVELHR